MRKITEILFTTDANHSKSSKAILGLFTSKHLAIAYAKKHSKKNGYGRLSANDLFNLDKNNQTQGRDENYMIESFIMDQKLI